MSQELFRAYSLSLFAVVWYALVAGPYLYSKRSQRGGVRRPAASETSREAYVSQGACEATRRSRLLIFGGAFVTCSLRQIYVSLQVAGGRCSIEGSACHRSCFVRTLVLSVRSVWYALVAGPYL